MGKVTVPMKRNNISFGGAATLVFMVFAMSMLMGLIAAFGIIYLLENMDWVIGILENGI